MTDDILGMIADNQSKRPELSPDTLLSAIKRSPATTEQLAAMWGVDAGAILALLGTLVDGGASLTKRSDGVWAIAVRPAPTQTNVVYESRPDHTFVFGVSSDQHLGSKYERLDVLHDLYNWFGSKGVDCVFNAGNWIDGDDAKTQHDVAVHGLDPQIDYLIANYPRAPFKTFAVWGEDHEGWYARRESIDVGRYVQRKMREADREDWIDLGFMEAAITLQNHETSVTAPPLLVMHPGGGTAYALSYRPQKLVESLQGGEKPSVLIIGHYHKMSMNLIRNVWAIQAGCAQDQTPFMRKIPTEPHIGGLIVTLHQDPGTGAIHGCDVQWRQYFNKSYENGRWSKSGPVVKPEKTMVGGR